MPCDVVFIGEAPGHSEDVRGLPFVGPAGMLMNTIIERAIAPWAKSDPITFYLSNLVACIPLDNGKKTEEPSDESIRACLPRLTELISMANPSLIVGVGTLARDYLEAGWLHSAKIDRRIPRVSIMHPSAIRRMPFAARDLRVKQCVVTIRDAIDKYVKGEKKCQTSQTPMGEQTRPELTGYLPPPPENYDDPNFREATGDDIPF